MLAKTQNFIADLVLTIFKVGIIGISRFLYVNDLPDNLLKLMISFMAEVDKMTSSKTGTLPPTRPVLPPWIQIAILRL